MRLHLPANTHFIEEFNSCRVRQTDNFWDSLSIENLELNIFNSRTILPARVGCEESRDRDSYFKLSMILLYLSAILTGHSDQELTTLVNNTKVAVRLVAVALIPDDDTYHRSW